MFVWFRRLLRRGYLTLRRYLRRKRETEVPPSSAEEISKSSVPEVSCNGDVHRESISRPDIRSLKEGPGFESHPSHHYEEHVKETRSNIISAVNNMQSHIMQRKPLFSKSVFQGYFPKRTLKRSSLKCFLSIKNSTIYHRLTASFCACLNVGRGRGVDIF